ncbi:MAG: TonB-dependent receptor [Prevotellaceae bacterium]|jgi:hypothetical protein|nr:TonB-dependent receptor [Prevotellaceae bacterium]
MNTVHLAFGQHSISGKVFNAKDKTPIAYVFISIKEDGLWTTTNKDGAFSIKKVSGEKVHVAVSYLGYVKQEVEVDVTEDIYNLDFYLQEDNLVIEDVVITAKRKQDDISTSYVVDRVGLDHMQMIGVADVQGLLPGGQTNSNLHLATSSSQTIALRGAVTGESGNPGFGTAIEVDGVRLSNNSSINDETLKGVDIRSIASNNVESIELITGIAPVEYGDMTNGVVKINTKKGKSPFIIEMITKPNTKQISATKGFALGQKAGVLNASVERSKSIANLASPYTDYTRNNLSLVYENTFNKQNNRPITMVVGVTGNIGGYDSKADPDKYVNTYTKKKNNTLRAHAKLSWSINRTWITNLETSASVNYSNKQSETSTDKSSSTSVVSVHGKEEGYFIATPYDINPDAPIVILPAGYWYVHTFTDDKPIDIRANVKASWIHKFGTANSRLMLGGDFSRSGNLGRGVYYGDMRYAPTWREYRFDELPFMNNVSPYAEERLTIPIGKTNLQLMAGIRSDITFVKKSEYGIVHSFSPRFNAKYAIIENPKKVLERLNFRAGWGRSVKLPSFGMLYPEPSYSDRLAFAPGTLADGTIFYAYHIMPYSVAYNKDIAWQYNQQTEFGVEAKIKGIYLSLSIFDSKTVNTYTSTKNYQPFSYTFTDQTALDGSLISSGNRTYNVDQTTGIVTVSDKTGQLPDEILVYKVKNTFKSTSMFTNGLPPLRRRGVEWVVDFGRIRALQTSIRFDGNYYCYKGVEESISALSPNVNMADGTPYKYVGYYLGGSSSSNGKEHKELTSNLTFTTHIPKVRLIFSLKIEGTLYSYQRNLSESGSGERSFVLDDKGDYVPSTTSTDIYAGDQFVGLYPLFYTSFDDMYTKIPFAEKFLWAKDNDPTLYRELAKMVVKSNSDFYFNASKLSKYFSANFSVTKEIGSHLSITFNATNFTNNMGLVASSQTGTESSLYNSSYIPKFYYGLSVRIKL